MFNIFDNIWLEDLFEKSDMKMAKFREIFINICSDFDETLSEFRNHSFQTDPQANILGNVEIFLNFKFSSENS